MPRQIALTIALSTSRPSADPPRRPAGLHRLRLEAGLIEIRAADLRFSLAEAAELLASLV
jgi:ATP/maltotriose-dependent transcriptional regulator MalT